MAKALLSHPQNPDTPSNGAYRSARPETNQINTHMDYVAHPDGGMTAKDAEQPKVEDVKAPETKPEETAAAPAEEAKAPETAEETSENEVAPEAQEGEDAEKSEEVSSEEQDGEKEAE